MVDHTEPWNAPATRRDERPRPLESARCSLCGIELPKGLMMPDGGRACSDVRWYCKDTKSCTERWTARLPRATGPARKALDSKAAKALDSKAAKALDSKAPKALEAGPVPGPPSSARKAAPVRGPARSVPAEAGES
jgi:hypothetical protein